jgi:hypothetical protein
MSTKGVLVNKIDKIDKYAPVITIQGVPEDFTNKNVAVSMTAKDSNSGVRSMHYSTDSGKTWNIYTGSVTLTKNSWIHFRAVDYLGNMSIKGVLINKIDKIAPTLQLNTSGNMVSAAASDKQSGLASLEYSFNGKTYFSIANNEEIALYAGESIRFRAIDTAGNVTEKQYNYNTLDYNALKNYDTLAASDLTGNNPESDIMKGLLA